MSAEIALSFRDVSKVYPGSGESALHALRGVSVEVERGRAVAIVGRSGSGKSTLLHLAAGIDEPSSGRVELLGFDLATLRDRQRARVRRDRIGLVFQFFHLLPHLSVHDNVLLPSWIAADRGERARAARCRAVDLLDRVGLAERSRDPVQQLSGGEMQRVAICRALLREPDVVLADEPTGNLDDDNGRIVMDLLLGLAREEGTTLLYVTHSREAAALADETWRIHSGVLDAST
jgi:ABC-type lipoprotein export system ATPase subunit